MFFAFINSMNAITFTRWGCCLYQLWHRNYCLIQRAFLDGPKDTRLESTISEENGPSVNGEAIQCKVCLGMTNASCIHSLQLLNWQMPVEGFLNFGSGRNIDSLPFKSWWFLTMNCASIRRIFLHLSSIPNVFLYIKLKNWRVYFLHIDMFGTIECARQVRQRYGRFYP